MKRATISNTKSSSELKLRLSLCLPFVLFGIGLFLISLFFFKAFVQSSPIWELVFEEVPVADTVQTEPSYIGTSKLDKEIQLQKAPNNVPAVIVPTTSVNEVFDYIPTLPALKEGYCISSADVGGIPLGSYWATLSVADDERVDEVSVYQGDNKTLLSLGVGHLYGSCFPGEGGVCVLAAHVSGNADFFANLAEPDVYKTGTQVKVDTAYGVYVYEVVDTKILDYKDTSLVRNATLGKTAAQ